MLPNFHWQVTFSRGQKLRVVCLLEEEWGDWRSSGEAGVADLFAFYCYHIFPVILGCRLQMWYLNLTPRAKDDADINPFFLTMHRTVLTDAMLMFVL